jgi:hypothetical protein
MVKVIQEAYRRALISEIAEPPAEISGGFVVVFTVVKVALSGGFFSRCGLTSDFVTQKVCFMAVLGTLGSKRHR